jgi:hypothetical protein
LVIKTMDLDPQLRSSTIAAFITNIGLKACSPLLKMLKINLCLSAGKLTVPNLGGSIEPKPGFQLFLTERGGNNSSEIAKIAQVRSH